MVQVLEDSADSAPPIAAVDSHGYSYLIIGKSVLPSDRLKQILTDADEPSAALLELNRTLQQTDFGTAYAAITNTTGNSVVIRISQGPNSTHPEPETESGKASASNTNTTGSSVVIVNLHGPQPTPPDTQTDSGAAPAAIANMTGNSDLIPISQAQNSAPPEAQTGSDTVPAAIMNTVTNSVVIPNSQGPNSAPPEMDGPIFTFSTELPEDVRLGHPGITLGKKQGAPAKQTAANSAIVAAPLVTMESHGYTYEIVGQPFLSADEMRPILAQAKNPSDAIARLNEAVAQNGLALAGAIQERSGGSASRLLLLQWVAVLEVRARLEPTAQDMSHVNLKPSGTLNETSLAEAYSASDKEMKTVRIRLVKQPVAKLDAPGELRPFFRDVTDINLTQSSLLIDSAMATAYAARQQVQPKMNFATIPGSEAVRLSVDELPIHDAKPWNVNASLGNLGNRYAGRWQAQTSVAFRPGRGTEVTANYAQGLPGLDSASEGSNYRSEGTGASIVTPWGFYGVNYTQTRYRAIKIPAYIPLVDPNTLQILFYPGEQQLRGTIKSGSLSGEQILHTTDSTRWTLSEGLAHVDDVASVDDYYSGTFVENLPLYAEKYTFASVGVSATSRLSIQGHDAALTGSLKLAQGLSGDVGEFFLSGGHVANPKFFLAQGSMGYDQTLPADLKLGLTLSAQWTGDIVPHSQQLVVGGYGNLTAWLPGIVTGDRGGLFRTMLSTPAIRDGGGTFSFSLFYEAARVGTVDSGAPSQTLSDAGIGLVGDMPSLQYVFGYAKPLTSNNTDEALRDELRGHTFFNLTGKW